MHVEVTKMRRAGVKLNDGERNTPQIGFVRVYYWRLVNGREERLVRAISLTSVESDTASHMADMNEVELKELRGDHMLFVGQELVRGCLNFCVRGTEGLAQRRENARQVRGEYYAAGWVKRSA